MKKLILLFVLLPLFSFSQMILKEVTQQCFRDKVKGDFDCFYANETFSVEIENNDYLVVKSNGEIKKYKIIAEYIDPLTNIPLTDNFAIDFNGSEYHLLIAEDDEHKIVSISNDYESLIYSVNKKRG